MVTRELVIGAIGRALDLPDDFPLRPDTRIANVPGWDSLGWVNVAAAMEELSGREFPLERIAGIDTVDALFIALESVPGNRAQ